MPIAKLLPTGSAVHGGAARQAGGTPTPTYGRAIMTLARMRARIGGRDPTQRLGEGQRVPERLGTSYRCRELIEGPIRVTEHPGNQRRVELALHAGVGTRPIREVSAAG